MPYPGLTLYRSRVAQDGLLLELCSGISSLGLSIVGATIETEVPTFLSTPSILLDLASTLLGLSSLAHLLLFLSALLLSATW
jgi:hypothetical protein